MGSRSIVAIPQDNGFKGSYVHMGASPREMVPTLLALVADRGIEATADAILARPFWSILVATPAGEEPGDFMDPQAGDAHHTRADFLNSGPTNIEFVYILNGTELTVLYPNGTDVERVGGFAYGAEPDLAVMIAVECGENFEHCSHYGWYHTTSPEEAAAMGNLSMGVWLGHTPVGHDDALAYLTPMGVRIALNRSGGAGSATNPRDWNSKTRYWWTSSANGPVRTARILKSGAYRTSVPLVAPATKTTPEQIIPAGTLLPR